MDTAKPESEPRSHFIMIPNMADEELDIYEYRLFGHYSHVCGQKKEGRCFQSAETIRQITGMSYGVIKKARISLQSRGYIRVDVPNGKARNQGMNISVSLVDRWQENAARYQEVITNNESPDYGITNHLITNMELADYAAVPEQEELYKQESLKEEKTTAFAQPANQEPVADVSEDVVVSEGEKIHIRIFTPLNVPLLPASVAEPPTSSLPVEGAASSTSHPVPATLPPEPDDKPLVEQDNPLGRVLKLLESQEGWGKLALETDCKNAPAALDDYPEEWVKEAIKEAKFKGKKFWGFVNGCLSNWQQRGAINTSYNNPQDSPSSPGYVEPERTFMNFTGFQKFDTAKETNPC